MTPIRKAWRNMIRRCHNPKATDYARYGARGISVCERWRASLSDFCADVGPRPSSDYSLERIDNARGYEPGNVRWATVIEQANNKRTNHFVIYRGQRLTIAQATRAGKGGVTRETARCRIHNGWSVERAVDTPPLFRRDAQRKKIPSQNPRKAA